MNEQSTSVKRMKKQNSAWSDACNKAEDAITDLIAMQQEYQNEYDEMSERRQESAKGQKLQEIGELQLESALEIIQEASLLEAP
jgi:hypothetical protein